MLCPVVESTPALTEVLYNGATYLGSYSDILDFGIKQMAGKGGLISPRKSWYEFIKKNSCESYA